MIDWYGSFDEIHSELLENAARLNEEERELIFIGSGEDICIFNMKKQLVEKHHVR